MELHSLHKDAPFVIIDSDKSYPYYSYLGKIFLSLVCLFSGFLSLGCTP